MYFFFHIVNKTKGSIKPNFVLSEQVSVKQMHNPAWLQAVELIQSIFSDLNSKFTFFNFFFPFDMHRGRGGEYKHNSYFPAIIIFMSPTFNSAESVVKFVYMLRAFV